MSGTDSGKALPGPSREVSEGIPCELDLTQFIPKEDEMTGQAFIEMLADNNVVVVPRVGFQEMITSREVQDAAFKALKIQADCWRKTANDKTKALIDYKELERKVYPQKELQRVLKELKEKNQRCENVISEKQALQDRLEEEIRQLKIRLEEDQRLGEENRQLKIRLEEEKRLVEEIRQLKVHLEEENGRLKIRLEQETKELEVEKKRLEDELLKYHLMDTEKRATVERFRKEIRERRDDIDQLTSEKDLINQKFATVVKMIAEESGFSADCDVTSESYLESLKTHLRKVGQLKVELERKQNLLKALEPLCSQVTMELRGSGDSMPHGQHPSPSGSQATSPANPPPEQPSVSDIFAPSAVNVTSNAPLVGDVAPCASSPTQPSPAKLPQSVSDTPLALKVSIPIVRSTVLVPPLEPTLQRNTPSPNPMFEPMAVDEDDEPRVVPGPSIIIPLSTPTAETQVTANSAQAKSRPLNPLPEEQTSSPNNNPVNDSVNHVISAPPTKTKRRRGPLAPSIRKRRKLQVEIMFKKRHVQWYSRPIDGRWECSCGRDYKAKGSLNGHIRRFTNDWKFKCIYCKDKFFSLRDLKQHLKSLHDVSEPLKQFKSGCTLCGSCFRTRSETLTHQKVVHNIHGPARVFRRHPASRYPALCYSAPAAIVQKPLSPRMPSTEATVPDSPPTAAAGPSCNSPEVFALEEDSDDDIIVLSTPTRIRPPLIKIEEESEETPSFISSMHGVEDVIPLDLNTSQFVCRCGLEYESLGALQTHIQRAMYGKIFKCKSCHEGFYNFAEWSSHVSTAHSGSSGVKEFCCGLCGRSFGNAKIFHEHKQRDHSRI